MKRERVLTQRVHDTKARCAAVKKATHAPATGSRRKQQKLLTQRREALALVAKALAVLEKMVAKDRTLLRREWLSQEAERLSKQAASKMGVRYR